MPVRRLWESSPSPGGREGEAKGIFVFFFGYSPSILRVKAY